MSAWTYVDLMYEKFKFEKISIFLISQFIFKPNVWKRK